MDIRSTASRGAANELLSLSLMSNLSPFQFVTTSSTQRRFDDAMIFSWVTFKIDVGENIGDKRRIEDLLLRLVADGVRKCRGWRSVEDKYKFIYFPQKLFTMAVYTIPIGLDLHWGLNDQSKETNNSDFYKNIPLT